MTYNKIFKCVIISSIMLLISITSIAAQNNAIYGTGGIFYSLNYERTLTQSKENGNKLALKINRGKFIQFFYASDDSYEIDQISASLVKLIKFKRSYLDFGLGVGYGWSKKNHKPDGDIFIPNATAGYRYESKWALFRVGIGIPEIVYISAGVRF